MNDFLEKLARLDAMRGVVRAGVDAAGFFEVCAEVARSGFLLDGGFFAAGMLGIFGQDLEGMKIDVAVRTVARAKAAADAPIFDDDFQRIAAANGADGAANHAEWVAALAAACGDEKMIEAETIADQASHAIVCVGAGVHAGIATRAIFKIEHEEALRFHQTL